MSFRPAVSPLLSLGAKVRVGSSPRYIQAIERQNLLSGSLDDERAKYPLAMSVLIECPFQIDFCLHIAMPILLA
jgi:hypothetical protein